MTRAGAHESFIKVLYNTHAQVGTGREKRGRDAGKGEEGETPRLRERRKAEGKKEGEPKTNTTHRAHLR